MILAAALGMMAGMIIGLLPGIGATTLMLILFPILIYTDIVFVFVFYFSMLTTSQYFGSVTSIVYGYPGEISSMPAVRHGHALMRSGQGAQALAMTSTGSFFALCVSVILLWILYHNVGALSVLFQTKYLVPMYLTILTMVVIMNQQKLLSLCMMISGLVLGKIGYDSLHNQHLLVPMHTVLDAGIPFFPLFAGFLIVPMLISFIRNPMLTSNVQLFRITFKQRLSWLLCFDRWPSMLRGSLLGSVIGLVPGASYAVSSNIAETVESRFNKKDEHESLLIAAESANNSGAITVLIPLLLFAVPIIPSEAVMLSIVETMGHGTTTSLLFIKNHLADLIWMLLFIGIINWILAGFFFVFFIKIYYAAQAWIYPVMLLGVITIMCMVAYLDHQIWLSLCVFVLAFMVGIAIKDHGAKTVMILAFFLSDSVLDEIYRGIVIYF